MGDTPGRKRSQPIAIEPPSRGTAAYTPLSARGDLPGGYFPNHEEITKPYRSHPFSYHHGRCHRPSVLHRTQLPRCLPTCSAPQPLVNYPPRSPRPFAFPWANTIPRTPLPPTNLSIPTTSSKRGSKERPGHERKSSDIKRKLQQYQREMIAQARAAAPTMKDGRISKEPSSPRLQPLGSPGPITPFDL